VHGTFVTPVVLPIPDNPANNIVTAPPGDWSIAPQVTTIGGLLHLVGLTVSGVADGVPIPPAVVSAQGTIALPFPASAVTVGLPFTAQLQTVYAEPGSQPTVQGRRKDITAATVRLEASAGLQAATNQLDASTTFPPSIQANWSPLVPVINQGATYTSPGGATVTQLFTGDERVNLFASWRKPGQVAFQQSEPFPMQIIAIVPEGLEGDTPEAAYTPQQGQSRGPGIWQLRRA
jgi:hypothetical protein